MMPPDLRLGSALRSRRQGVSAWESAHPLTTFRAWSPRLIFDNKCQRSQQTANYGNDFHCIFPMLFCPRIQELRLSNSPDRYSAYNMILQAEQRAVQQQAQEDIMSARVVGYLLLEFIAQCDALGDSPCASLVKWVTSPPQSTGDNVDDVIFGVGKLCRDKFICLCAFQVFFPTRHLQQLSSSNVQHPVPTTLLTPFTCFL